MPQLQWREVMLQLTENIPFFAICCIYTHFKPNAMLVWLTNRQLWSDLDVATNTVMVQPYTFKKYGQAPCDYGHENIVK